jgi:hypothetical protein
MLQLCLFISICLVALSISSAQIPNAGFETWAGGSPTGWTTSNVLTITPITQTSDAHSGTSAMQGATVAYLTINYPPSAYADFAISSRYSSLKGWYKYSPVGGDTLLIHAVFFKGGAGIGFTQFFTAASVTSYTQFTAPITYFTSDVPDEAYIEMSFIPSGPAYHVGTTFKIDDLSFGAPTGVEESFSLKPNVFALSQNFPNPFNPSTTISFSVPSQSYVSLKIFDCLGKEVGTIVSEELSAGNYSKQWNASSLPSGVYYYRLQSHPTSGGQAGSFTETKKLILMK